MKITKDTKMVDIIMMDSRAIDILEEHDMYCSDCNAVFTGTLGEAAEFHNTNVDELMEELNKL